MPNRREFLQTGAVVSALAINGLRAPDAAALGTTPDRAAPPATIYDDRYAEGRRFAAALHGAQGVPRTRSTAATSHDSTYERLDALWRSEPVTIAGLTQFGPMFVLEQLAGERAFTARAARRASRHDTTARSHIADHGAARPLSIARPSSRRCARTGRAVMAALACGTGADRSRPHATPTLFTSGLSPTPTTAPGDAVLHSLLHAARGSTGHGVALDGPLYSWVIAPRRARNTMPTLPQGVSAQISRRAAQVRSCRRRAVGVQVRRRRRAVPRRLFAGA